MPVPNNFHLTAIKRHPYSASFGTTVIAPLASAPEIEGNAKLLESRICDGSGESAVSFLTGNHATVTLKTKDVETALSLISDFSEGSDVFAASRSKALSFVPVTAATEKTLTFTNAFLLPELSYAPGMGSDHVATLVFRALPDEVTGKLFTFA